MYVPRNLEYNDRRKGGNKVWIKGEWDESGVEGEKSNRGVVTVCRIEVPGRGYFWYFWYRNNQWDGTCTSHVLQWKARSMESISIRVTEVYACPYFAPTFYYSFSQVIN